MGKVCVGLYWSVSKKLKLTRVEFNWLTFRFLWIIDTLTRPLKLNLKSLFSVYIWAFHDQRSQSGQRVGDRGEEAERLWSDSANQETEAGVLTNQSTGMRDSVTTNISVINQTQSQTLNSSSGARSRINFCLLFVIKWLFGVMSPRKH